MEQAVAICPDQRLDIAAEGRSQRHCMSRTQVVQNGNVRTYRVEEELTGRRELKVDAAGETIVAVELVMDAGDRFGCRWSHCKGVSVGPHDAQGARSIVFERTRLGAMVVSAERKEFAGAERDEAAGAGRDEADGAAVGNGAAVHVHGTLRTLPDDQLRATTCVGQILYISQGAGTQHFCPDGGTGFDVEDDGGRTYRFTNADGDSLGVGMDEGGALRSVEYKEFVCHGSACTGVHVAPGGADGRRHFAFQGTTLLDRNSASVSVILNGNVVLEAQ